MLFDNQKEKGIAMTKSRRLAHLKERAEHLKSLKRNTRLSHFDLIESHRFLKYWIVAYHLGHLVVSVRDVRRYITILGPLWDFLKEHNLEINNHQDRRDLIVNYIHSRHSF